MSSGFFRSMDVAHDDDRQTGRERLRYSSHSRFGQAIQSNVGRNGLAGPGMHMQREIDAQYIPHLYVGEALLAFHLILLLNAIPLGHGVHPILVLFLSAMQRRHGVSQAQDDGRVRQVVVLFLVSDLLDRHNDDSGTAAEHSAYQRRPMNI